MLQNLQRNQIYKVRKNANDSRNAESKNNARSGTNSKNAMIARIARSG